jgi:hypothetical protein
MDEIQLPPKRSPAYARRSGLTLEGGEGEGLGAAFLASNLWVEPKIPNREIKIPVPRRLFPVRRKKIPGSAENRRFRAKTGKSPRKTGKLSTASISPCVAAYVLQMFHMKQAREGGEMVSRVSTVAFEGVEARPVDVQVQIASGTVVFMIVGLGDKAVAESRERVRSALIASGLALPAKRITVNLAPADMPKEGSHYDLPIALGVMAAIGAIPHDALEGYVVIGELALDGTISAVAGVLPAAIAANAAGKGLICPAPCGPERRPGPRPISTFSRPAR